MKLMWSFHLETFIVERYADEQLVLIRFQLPAKELFICICILKCMEVDIAFNKYLEQSGG